MQWQATDQFGNLYVGESAAQTLEELRPHLLSLIRVLHERNPRPFSITIDPSYGEINGPDPDQVSHVLQVAWLTSCNAQTIAAIKATVEELLGEEAVIQATVNLAE
jgi:hypothetical protein